MRYIRIDRDKKLPYIDSCSGRSAAWLARLHGVQEAGGSNPLAPTRDKSLNSIDLQLVFSGGFYAES